MKGVVWPIQSPSLGLNPITTICWLFAKKDSCKLVNLPIAHFPQHKGNLTFLKRRNQSNACISLRLCLAHDSCSINANYYYKARCGHQDQQGIYNLTKIFCINAHSYHVLLPLIRKQNQIFSFENSEHYCSLNFRLLLIEKDKHH